MSMPDPKAPEDAERSETVEPAEATDVERPVEDGDADAQPV